MVIFFRMASQCPFVIIWEACIVLFTVYPHCAVFSHFLHGCYIMAEYHRFHTGLGRNEHQLLMSSHIVFCIIFNLCIRGFAWTCDRTDHEVDVEISIEGQDQPRVDDERGVGSRSHSPFIDLERASLLRTLAHIWVAGSGKESYLLPTIVPACFITRCCCLKNVVLIGVLWNATYRSRQSGVTVFL